MATTTNLLSNSTAAAAAPSGGIHPNQTAASCISMDAQNQLILNKLLASLSLFLVTLICGYLPVKVIINKTLIEHAMFLGGGVLMATAFCHLLPEAIDGYKQLGHAHSHDHSHAHTQEQPPPDNFPQLPYVEVALCCGFFFIYLAETLMQRFINNHTHEHPCEALLTDMRITAQQLTDSAKHNHSQNHHHHHHQHQHADSPDIYRPAALSRGSSLATIQPASSTSHILSDESSARRMSLGAGSASSGSTTGQNLYKFLRGFMIISAFGVHSIFDGVAIGSQETIENVWTIFAAISCHKLIIVAVVGLELFAATLQSHLWTLFHLTLFSIMSPIGIILVVIAQESLSLSAESPVMILLQSFATGTLLFIIFIEILQPKESANKRHQVGKCFSLLLGFVLMLLVLTFIAD